MMPDAIGFSRLRRTVERQGYRWDGRDWGLNLVGIRAADRDSNYFNDWIAAAWHQGGRGNLIMLPATTDPGSYWRTHPMNPKGTAILAPGRYPGMWRLGLHRGQYEALVQIGACIVYRDNDRDQQLDGQLVDHGIFGINLHRAADSYERSAGYGNRQHCRDQTSGAEDSYPRNPVVDRWPNPSKATNGSAPCWCLCDVSAVHIRPPITGQITRLRQTQTQRSWLAPPTCQFAVQTCETNT